MSLQAIRIGPSKGRAREGIQSPRAAAHAFARVTKRRNFHVLFLPQTCREASVVAKSAWSPSGGRNGACRSRSPDRFPAFGNGFPVTCRPRAPRIPGQGCYQALTASRRAIAALNAGARDGAMSTDFPVRGLRPRRAGRSRVVNFPTPATETVSLRVRAAAITENSAPAAAAASAFDDDVAAVTCAHSSDRVTANLSSSLHGGWSTMRAAMSRAASHGRKARGRRIFGQSPGPSLEPPYSKVGLR